MKKITFILFLCSITTFAQVSIPDVNFETELIAQSIDTDGIVNGQISNADALAVTGTLNIDSKNISDLTGIEAFTNLTQLHCEYNNLSTLDVSTLTSLKQLRCRDNNLSTLNVDSNTALTHLRFRGNNISTINIANNTLLIQVFAQSNMLTAINTTSNTILEQLRVQNNNLSSLDISSNSSLIQLRCQGNSNLAELNGKNGNNTNMTFFLANNNPSLSCIEVDDVAYADANFTKPASAIFSTNCTTLLTSDYDLAQKTIIYPNPTSNSISISSPNEITSLEVYTLLGKLVLISESKKTIDLSSIKSGIYLLKIKSEKLELVKKIIKS
ncbi:T9SS type A sorting domain-containing protein [Tenacibaculum sp. 1_MG-2023]|uniref:T9SS type A sorting domain-containing protein n=1 Tax=Tenacibaculum sp. 1_MG-2023 TaxID=3062653 RepID=UPI0026E286E7|nr:T9SS type A sorting domain-containing protein [Tenacibaculum sp. 1_MG-2023]MDO6598722.1 T9SS type A sorting domain-containing protein [Tenacibaculum sp. 1_MG-2023]